MIVARQCKEVSVHVFNDIGILAQLTKLIAEKGVNIRAMAAWIEGEHEGVIRLVTDDNLRAMDVLRAHNYAPEEVDSIEMPLKHSPGMLSSLYETMGHGGLNIQYLYASSPVSNDTCLTVLSTDNNERALVLLNE